MTAYAVFYMTPEWFRDGIMGRKPNLEKFAETHKFVRMVEARDLDHVYYQCQGEIWSPNGEQRDLIRSLGLEHTSMSVGDIIVSPTEPNNPPGGLYVVASVGFTRLSVAWLIEREDDGAYYCADSFWQLGPEHASRFGSREAAEQFIKSAKLHDEGTLRLRPLTVTREG
jgi:hypothetical protein